MRRLIVSLVLGAAIGTGIGLYVGWVVAPVQYVNADMANLAARYKNEYTIMVAAGYQVDHDLNEAIRRLRSLGYPNVPIYVRDVTERYISESGIGKETDIRLLVTLSKDLGHFTPPMYAFAAPTAAPTPSS
jgi:hypothetical protein